MERTETLLQQLEPIFLKTNTRELFFIDTLKQTPRSGKRVRMEKYGLPLPIRSVYDHIASLSSQADFFLKFSSLSIDKAHLETLIVFHDLSEALIGDIPDYTSCELAAGTYMTREEKIKAEALANEFLRTALPEHLKVLFDQYLILSEEKDSDIYRFFHMIDKSDPIIATWRYLSLLRHNFSIDDFLTTMSDFFTNPKPQHACINELSHAILLVLRNPELAKQYHHNPNEFFHAHFEKTVAKDLAHLIETRPMHFVTELKSCEKTV